MSDMGFGVYDTGNDGTNGSGLGDQPPAGAEPKWFRDYMEKARERNEKLEAEVTALRQKDRVNEVGRKLSAAGYDPAAAALYQGEPEKVDEWLSTHGALLAQRPQQGDAGQPAAEQTPAGPPASTVPLEVQAQMQRMQEAGAAGTAGPKSSEAEIAASIMAANSPEELAKIMQAQGNRFTF